MKCLVISTGVCWLMMHCEALTFDSHTFIMCLCRLEGVIYENFSGQTRYRFWKWSLQRRIPQPHLAALPSYQEYETLLFTSNTKTNALVVWWKQMTLPIATLQARWVKSCVMCIAPSRRIPSSAQGQVRRS